MKTFKLLVTLFALVWLTSCIEDGFSTTERLEFSTDTVAFDTVITLQGSATKQMVVYNRGKKQVRISSIKVTGSATGGRFFLNVDGQRGDVFHDVEVRGGDSIYVFVEGYIDEMKSDDPTFVKDFIEFDVNGATQRVVLTAWGQDVVRLHGDTLRRSQHFTDAKPYLIYDTLFVPPGVTLTLDPGTRLLFHDKGALRCYGTLLAMGTREKPISMRGDRLDHVVAQIPFEIMSGQWGGLILGPTSYGNELQYVDMSGSSIGIHTSAPDTTRRALHIFNSILRNSSSSILTSGGAWIDAEGSVLSDAASAVANFIGGRVNFVNCTLANYYLFKALEEPIVNFYVQDDGKVVDVLHAEFVNCIVHGLTQELNMPKLDKTNCFMRNCLFKSGGEDDSHFFNCVWKADPKFYTHRETYLFDYRLQEGSDAIGKGDASRCPASARYDRYGNDRFAGPLDVGAFVYKP